jgi:fluoride exporter
VLPDLILIALGGAAGGVARVWIGQHIQEKAGSLFPWGTLAVNGSGALAIGLLARPLAENEPAALALLVGLLGSYTTVSAFSLEMLTMLQRGRRRRAAAYAGASFLACLGGAAFGLALGG